MPQMHEVPVEVLYELRRLRSFRSWLLSLDEPESADRRTVTLTQIIDAARRTQTPPLEGTDEQ